MTTAAQIVAAGRGLRAGGGVPKQYRPVAGTPLLKRTLNAVLAHSGIDLVQVVIHDDDRDLYASATDGLKDARLLEPAQGGPTRAASVRAGLEALEHHKPANVLIHDAARPFVSHDVLDAVLGGLRAHDGAFPAIPVADALWRMGAPLSAVSRADLIRAQTPQGFRFDAILAAHRAGDADAADDVEIAIAAGLDVVPVQGDDGNFKVTEAQDFHRAEKAARVLPDIRTGQGFDVHAFEPGNAVTLCGVSIPHDKSLRGHSDADVALHAITDAIYGALAEGDIGQWFPPSDEQWKAADSAVFLGHAVQRAQSRGFTITHVDCTIVCERPKIGPHASAMRERLSTLTGIEKGRISVKATTSEQLGFTGRGEGIAAMATTTLVAL